MAAAAAEDGRGHIARALALGEALVALAAGRGGAVDVELALIRGQTTGNETARASAAGLRLVAADQPFDRGSIVVLDVPDINAIAAAHEFGRLVVFDDRDAFRGHAAIVVQPSMERWSGPGAADAVLAGYAFAPLATRLRQLPTTTVACDGGDERRVFVCFGGSDPARVTERLVDALATIGIDVDVVIGAGFQGPTAGWPLRPLRDPPDALDRLARADVAVLGAGTMKFEAACLGRPMVLVAAADDQLRVGPPFAATGAGIYLGDGRTIEPEVVAEHVRQLLADPERRTRLGRRAREVVDGLGAVRIAGTILTLDR